MPPNDAPFLSVVRTGTYALFGSPLGFDRGRRGGGGGGSGGNLQAYGGGGGGGGGYQERGWQRGQAAPMPAGVNRKAKMPFAKPKPVITDPLIIFTREVQAILNKITPQNFKKLVGQLAAVKVTSNRMLQELIKLVFEKAVQEPSFSSLYAEMCIALEQKFQDFSFLYVFHNTDANQYRWLTDVAVEVELLGPFNSVEVAMEDAMKTLEEEDDDQEGSGGNNEEEPNASKASSVPSVQTEELLASHGVGAAMTAIPANLKFPISSNPLEGSRQERPAAPCSLRLSPLPL